MNTAPLSQNSIPNIQALTAACDELSVKYSFHDINNNFMAIYLDRPYYFANASTPLNDEAVSKICKDKEFTYRLIGGIVRMPKTLGFVNPNCDSIYKRYIRYFSYQEILEEVEKDFAYPLIIKMNSGSRGANIFKCSTPEEITAALKEIYNKNSSWYDYIALAQEYIKIRREFRVIIFNQKIVLAYEKDFSQAVFTGNLSPFHQENARAVFVKDQAIMKRFADFIKPMFAKLPVVFAGLDIAIDDEDKLYLIELNSKPGFEYFVRDNGLKKLVPVYKLILEYLTCLARKEKK